MFHLLLDTITEVQQALPQHPLQVTSTNYVKLAVSLVALVFVLWFLLWILRKVSGSKLGFFHSDAGIRILERKSISPKTALFIVEVDGQKMLVSESSQRVKIVPMETTPES